MIATSGAEKSQDYEIMRLERAYQVSSNNHSPLYQKISKKKSPKIELRLR